ncbi:hypothetical protein [Laceyella sacchari]
MPYEDVWFCPKKGKLRKERGMWDGGWTEAKNIADKKGPAA